MISAYSFVTSVVIYNIALVFVCMLRKRHNFLAYHGNQTLILLTVLGVLRLFSPLDLERAIIVHSDKVVPAIQSVLGFAPVPGADGVTIGAALALVWLVGSCVMLVRNVSCFIRDQRHAASLVRVQIEQVDAAVRKMKIKYPVIVSPQVSVPHTAGFFRPAIYLPPLKLSDEEWEYILRHELQHIESRDVAIKLFYLLIESVFWWNPVSHLFVRELDAMLEIRCDGSLAAKLDDKGRLDYMDAVLSVMRQTMPGGRAPAAGISAVDYGAGVRQRFQSVLYFGQDRLKPVHVVTCILSIVLFIFSYFIILQPVYYPPIEEIEANGNNYVEVTEDNSFILFDGEKYWLYIDNEMHGEVPESELDVEPYKFLEIIDGRTAGK